MGQNITLTAKDGFKLGAYRADPQGTPKGGMVVVQEIFGVNHHIRSVVDRYAAEGYAAIAPALFDRQVKDFQSGYTPDEITEARKFIANPNWDQMLMDTDAAAQALKSAGPVGVVGFCMGGSIAFLAATRLSGISAAVGYYGGAIAKHAGENPKCPVMLHFGAQDQGIPLSDVDVIKQKRPEIEIFIYDEAGHGFSCDERGSFHGPSADIAWTRTQEFFKKHMNMKK